jgi:hydrogenase maturation factor
MSALEKLTEGIVARDLGQEGAALLNKWESTGLLEGLGNDVTKNNMARLLENQAKQLLKEASAQWKPVMSRAFQPLHSQSFVAFSVS